MKSIKSKNWYQPVRLFSLALLAGLFVSMNACNNSGKEKKSDVDTTKEKDTSEMAVTSFKLYALKLNQAKFNEIFASMDVRENEKIKMIYFEFTNGGYKGAKVLVAHGADSKGIRVNEVDVQLDTVGIETGVSINISNTNLHEYSQQVTRGHIKLLLDLPYSTTPIGDTKFKEVWLTPCVPGGALRDTVVYVMTGAGVIGNNCRVIAFKVGEIVTNPSPPGNPCYNECDDPDFLFRKVK